MATNRHISCGALELTEVVWVSMSLSGQSELVADDEYIIYLTEPGNYKMKEIKCSPEIKPFTLLNNGIREIHLKSSQGGNIKWEVTYNKSLN